MDAIEIPKTQYQLERQADKEYHDASKPQWIIEKSRAERQREIDRGERDRDGRLILDGGEGEDCEDDD